MIVVDSNVLAYLYLPTNLSGQAEQLLEKDSSWAAPLLWRSEFRNILAGYLRRGTLTLELAQALQAEAQGLMSGAEYEVDSRQVLELVQQSDCSAYDCEFVALAMNLGVGLVTNDKLVLKAFPNVAAPIFRG